MFVRVIHNYNLEDALLRCKRRPFTM